MSADDKCTSFPESLSDFGYGFNEEGKLRKIDTSTNTLTDIPFDFSISSDPVHNQKHYDALGEVVTGEVYKLLEEKGLKRLPVPPNSVNSSFIFSTDSMEKEKIMIFINGSGVVRAGQWSRSLIINDSLKSGTQIPYIQNARELGYGVIVLNTNDNYHIVDRKKIPIKGSSSPQEHAKTVWENYISPAKAKKIAIVAHSFGGIVTMSLASHFEADFLNRVFAIALTDSVHGKIPRAVSSTLADHLSKVGYNWVSHSGPLDEPLPEQTGEIQCLSAGTTKHEMTSYSSMSSVFSFIEERLHLSSIPKNDDL